MNAQWNKLIARVAIWVVAEVLLNLSGLDTLADYSEFFFEHQESRFDGKSISHSPQRDREVHTPAPLNFSLDWKRL